MVQPPCGRREAGDPGRTIPGPMKSRRPPRCATGTNAELVEEWDSGGQQTPAPVIASGGPQKGSTNLPLEFPDGDCPVRSRTEALRG